MPTSARVLSLPPVRFVLVGIANTLIGLLVIYILKWEAELHDLTANLIGYLVGLLVSYFLNARWTFSSRSPHGRALPRFILTIVVAYAANLAAVYAALRLSIDSYFAQAAGVAPYALVTYFGSKLFVFRDRDGTQADARSAA